MRVDTPGAEISLRLPRGTPSDRLIVHATRAPDFGRIQVFVDDVPAGAPVDLFAPRVLPTGPLKLPVAARRADERIVTFRVVGKNPVSKGHHFGVDTLEIGQ